MRLEQEPVVTKETRGRGGDSSSELEHPAFGTITMTTVSGGGKTLFGSDIGHNQRIRIEINRAKLIRNLSNDWIHGSGRIVEFEMSHAQFITSVGNGSGTPITITSTEGDRMVPSIKSIESKNATFRREIADASKSRIDAMQKQIDRLSEMIESGRTGKKELREIAHSLKCDAQNLPANMSFVVSQAEEALDKATSDAKIEIESYISATAHRLGLERITDLAKIDYNYKRKLKDESL